MKNLLILGPIVVIILIVFVMTVNTSEAPKAEPTPADVITNDQSLEQEITTPEQTEEPTTKLKADTFSGTLLSVDTSCFADGECFVMVDDKKVTAITGWSQETVGKVMGVEGFGDLENYIGQQVEVYAQDNSDGTYTLYGSEGFYIKLLP